MRANLAKYALAAALALAIGAAGTAGAAAVR